MFNVQKMESSLTLASSANIYPSELVCFCGGHKEYQIPHGHYFGVVVSGAVTLVASGRGEFPLLQGMYFSVPDGFELRGAAQVALFLRHGYRGLFSIGGPIEKAGRLCYIDNASTTILCPPPRNGDPCLNLLTFPANTKQSQHIHPTVRLGAVISGAGVCVLGNGQRKDLEPGQVFIIEEQAVHSFESGPEGLSVIAYHPDSEAGPTDSFHPMLNRTYLDK